MGNCYFLSIVYLSKFSLKLSCVLVFSFGVYAMDVFSMGEPTNEIEYNNGIHIVISLQ